MTYKGVFLFQNIIKDIFLVYITYMAYIALKKKVGKIAIFGPKPWVNVFGKMSIFRLFEFLVFIAQKGVVSFQNVVNDIFQAFISLKEDGKMAMFGPKSWINPFGKISIFRLFEVLSFLAQKGVFSFYNIIEYIFLVYIAEKKNWKNGHFWTKTMG